MEDRNPKVKNQLNTAADEKKRIEELWQNIDCRKLLAHMSHDLRSPLSNVLGLTELARNKSDDREYVEYCLEKIDASAHFLMDMLTDVLYIIRLEAGENNLRKSSVDLKEFFNSLSDTARAMAYEKRLNFFAHFDEQIVPLVRTDGSRVRQVLQNLLSNAVKFTPRFGRVDFSAKLLEADNDRVRIRFTVKDTGVGIADELKDIIFLPLTKEYSGSTNVYGGSGLGLAICKQLVDRLGGTLDFTSSKGNGSEFWVVLDFEQDKAALQRQAEVPAQAVDFSGKYVLLAEDNHINCEIVKRLLTRRGLTVETAENGQIALNKYMMNAPRTYDLILMDVRMPYMDGLKAARMIRASGKSDAKTIPIMAMTANAYEEDIQQSMEAGMNAHLVKPVEPSELYRAVQRALNGEL
ncbi:hybrid sensor histidine kinase/response regulator [Anaerovibrio slackiae]|uniref:hybrid sensor histidine kinase/response regulator n=1 Tax=Anaerovibrio slackiae TaxID=2652309 RepID=UPI003F189152